MIPDSVKQGYIDLNRNPKYSRLILRFAAAAGLYASAMGVLAPPPSDEAPKGPDAVYSETQLREKMQSLLANQRVITAKDRRTFIVREAANAANERDPYNPLSLEAAQAEMPRLRTSHAEAVRRQAFAAVDFNIMALEKSKLSERQTLQMMQGFSRQPGFSELPYTIQRMAAGGHMATRDECLASRDPHKRDNISTCMDQSSIRRTAYRFLAIPGSYVASIFLLMMLNPLRRGINNRFENDLYEKRRRAADQKRAEELKRAQLENMPKMPTPPQPPKKLNL